jgi:predicted RNase H-like HicB family nuclease
MLTRYIAAALRQAHYEIMSDDGTFFGEIADCPSVYANAPSLEECREELAEVLEAWLLFRIHNNRALPTIDGLELKVDEEVAT